MKAKLVERPPPGNDWDYEIKWDGIRALAIKNGRSVELISRNEKSLTSEFPEVRDAIASLPVEAAVVDGEVCALDSEGRPSFRLLQKRAVGEARPPIFLYAFDLVHLEGQDLTEQPLRERKSQLEQLLSGAEETLRYSASLDAKVEKLLEDIRSRGMEGLIGKRRDSKYEAGKRSGAWVKIKVSGEQEFVIGGYTAPKGTRRYFGALLIGYYEGKKLRFASKVGAGFDHEWLQRLHRLLQPLKTKNCPFSNLAKSSARSETPPLPPSELRNCTWVRPKLVCQIKFAEWTDDGSLRQPVFLGLREDVAAGDVVGQEH